MTRRPRSSGMKRRFPAAHSCGRAAPTGWRHRWRAGRCPAPPSSSPAGLGIARRRLGEMLVGARPCARCQRIALGHRRQHAAVVVLRRSSGPRGRVSGSRRRRAIEPVARRVGPLPSVTSTLIWSSSADCIWQARRVSRSARTAGLVGVEVSARPVGGAGDVGRADRLMRFLRVLGLAAVFARRGRQIVRRRSLP